MCAACHWHFGTGFGLLFAADIHIHIDFDIHIDFVADSAVRVHCYCMDFDFDWGSVGRRAAAEVASCREASVRSPVSDGLERQWMHCFGRFGSEVAGSDAVVDTDWFLDRANVDHDLGTFALPCIVLFHDSF